MTETASVHSRIIVSGALFSPDGRLLLLHRKPAKDDAKNALLSPVLEQWEMPSGLIEIREPPETGLIRIFAETTNLDVRVHQPLRAPPACGGDRQECLPHHLQECLPQHRQECLPYHPPGPNDINHHITYLDFWVKLSAALLYVDIDWEFYSGFRWVTRNKAATQIALPLMRASAECAFNLLASSK